MSLGYCGLCQKIIEDEEFVLYEYISYRIGFVDNKNLFDGLIMIKKSSLIEPERREKFRLMPSGRRKKFTKNILREVPLYELIESGDVQIENCSHAWKFLQNGVDLIAYRMCRKIFEEYQQGGTLPKKSGYFV